MPVEQPVLDTNYKHLKVIRTWQKNDVNKNDHNYSNHSSIQRRNKMPTKTNQKQTNKPKKKATKNRVVGGGGGEINREQNN